jgi:hypothetical protein
MAPPALRRGLAGHRRQLVMMLEGMEVPRARPRVAVERFLTHRACQLLRGVRA